MTRSLVFSAALPPSPAGGATARPDHPSSGHGAWRAGSRKGVEWSMPESLRLDVGRPDHLAPFFCLLDDNLVEFSRRARKRRCAQVSEPRRDLGVGEPRIDLFVELVDDLDGRVPRSSDPNPRAGLEAWLELGKRWNFR